MSYSRTGMILAYLQILVFDGGHEEGLDEFYDIDHTQVYFCICLPGMCIVPGQ